MFLRVVVFYLVTLLFSGGLNAVQAGTGPDTGLIQLVTHVAYHRPHVRTPSADPVLV